MKIRSSIDVNIFTHNHEAFISQTLGSVLAQKTSHPFTIRLHDDASSDETVKIAKQILRHSLVPYEIFVQPTPIYPITRRFFIDWHKLGMGDFVATLDGDDYWISRNKLESQANFLDRFQEVALCHHPFMPSSGKPKRVIRPAPKFRRKIVPGLLLSHYNFIGNVTVMFRKSVLEDTFFSESFYQLRLQDYSLWSLLGRGGQIGYISDLRAVYREHAGNTWHALPPEDKEADVIEVLSFMASDPQVPDNERALFAASIQNRLSNSEGPR